MRSSPASDYRASATTFAIITLGCKVNQYESQAMREMCLAAGMTETQPLDGPDLVVLNTCTVTAHSSAECRHWLSRLRRRTPHTRLVATGCCTAVEPDVLAEADVVVAQEEKHSLRRILGLSEEEHSPKSNIDMEIHGFACRTRAYLRVQDGCSRHCSYCAVPAARGSSVSKTAQVVLREARGLAEAGYPEIVICGVDLGSYGSDLRDGVSLDGLLDDLLSLGLPTRFRISSIDPTDVTRHMIQLAAQTDALCPHFHLPLQSGDPDVLQAMKRRYTPDRFRSTVEAIRAAIDRPAITTDCMVGFPGETDDAFERTRSLARASEFSRIHVFRFSSRPGVPAGGLPNRVREGTQTERLRVLIDDARTLADAYRTSLTAVENPALLRVVVEYTGETASRGLAGRYVRVHLPGRAAVAGSTVKAVGRVVSGSHIVADPCRIASEKK